MSDQPGEDIFKALPELFAKLQKQKQLSDALRDLDSFLQGIFDDLSNENPPPKEVARAISYVVIALHAHMARTGHLKHLVDNPRSIMPYVHALSRGYADSIDRKNIHMLYEQLSSVSKIVQPIETHRSVAIGGFDPRYSVGNDSPANDERAVQIVCDLYGIPFEKHNDYDFRLQKSYQDGRKQIEQCFGSSPVDNLDVIVVDFALLPELAATGNLTPLDSYLGDASRRDFIMKGLEGQIDPGDHHGIEKGACDLIEHLCAAGNHQLYALPLWINHHGLMMVSENEEERNKAPVTYSKYLTIDGKDWPEELTVQTGSGSSFVYQLYAHFSYEGVLPIKLDYHKRTVEEMCFGGGSDEASERARRAISVLFARIYNFYFKRLKHNDDNMRIEDIFSINHEKEVEHIHSSNGGSPAFSTELAYRAWLHLQRSPPKDWNEDEEDRPSLDLEVLKNSTDIINPIKNNGVLGRSQYLNSFGGYGLAVTRNSKDIFAAVSFVKQCYEASKVSMFHSSIRGLFLDSNKDDKFFEKHTRPRVPFWTRLEQTISYSLEDLLLQIVETMHLEERVKADGKERAFEPLDETKKKFFEKLNEGAAKKRLDELEIRLRSIFIDQGWAVDNSGAAEAGG